MELELGLALPNNENDGYINRKSCKKYINRNPRFVCDEGDEVESKDSSLVMWSGQPNEDDDHKSRRVHVNEYVIFKY